MRKGSLKHSSAIFAFVFVSISSIVFPFNIAADDEISVPTVVFIIPQEYEETSSSLEDAIQSQLSDLDITLNIVRRINVPGELQNALEIARDIAAEREARVVFWYHELETTQLFLYLIQHPGDHVLVRAIKEETAGGRTEAAAIIVRLSVRELIQGGTIGIKIPEQRQDKPFSNAARDNQSNSGRSEKQAREIPFLINTLSYAYHAHSTRHPAIHGLDLKLGIRVHRNWTMFAGYTVMSSLENETDDVSLTYSRHPARLGGMWSAKLGWVELGASLAAIFDYSTYEARFTQTSRRDTHFLVSALPSIEFIFWITNHIGLTVTGAAEIALNPEYYGYTDIDGRHILLDAWRVQPWAMVGMVLGIL